MLIQLRQKKEVAQGNRTPNTKARKATQEEFGSGDILYDDAAIEENSYTVLLQLLNAYDKVRDLDGPDDEYDY